MRFELLDAIELVADDELRATKHVGAGEDYLADHFPRFPVLPGVLALEALVQAAGWLAHERRGFARSMAVLSEARGVRYGRFVRPGEALALTVRLTDDADDVLRFEGRGEVDAERAVSARLELRYFDLAEQRPELAELDARISADNRRRHAQLARGGALRL